MFPRGLPGLALVLLRASVSMALLIAAFSHRQELYLWLQLAVVLTSAALFVGFLTPIAAVLALVVHSFIAFVFADGSVAVAVALAVDAVALALLGPGAYSIDSRRFGRRIVLLPPE